jgi:hypothetical protein
MSTLLEQVTNAWKDAMRSGEAVRKDTLSSLRAAIKNGEINSRGSGAEFDEAAAQATIEKEAKKRREAIVEYEKAGRQDLADREKAELAVISEFLPEQLTEEELATLVRETIAEVGASSPKDMGKVMGVLVPRIAGRADGKVASALVKQSLSG